MALTCTVTAPSAALAGAETEAEADDAEELTPAQREFASIEWTAGPATVDVGSEGQLQLPEGFRFTGPAGARKLLELMHNPTYGGELGIVTDELLSWYLLFEFDDIGYVKDAEKEKLESDKILASIRESNEAGNEARKERGWPPIRIVGWHTAPFYNKETQNLEWCIEGESEGRKIINYNTRVLGRGGVMSANLLVDPEDLDQALPVAKQVLASYSYKEGRRYAEFRAGDKVAKYGLAALVVGGAVGVAAKAGFLAKIAASLGKAWKFVIIGIIGLFAAIKRLFVRKRS